MRAAREFYLFDKVRALEQAFDHKPYVLFYEDLKHDPDAFLRELAQYLGVEPPAKPIERSRVNASLSMKQLKYMRRFARHMLPEQRHTRFRLKRSYAEVGRRLILWGALLLPGSYVADDPFLAEAELDRVDAFYAEDWQKCVAYAHENNAALRDEIPAPAEPWHSINEPAVARA